jgi:hypothetical protein
MTHFIVTSSAHHIATPFNDYKVNKALFRRQWVERLIKSSSCPSIGISYKLWVICISCKFMSITFSLLVVQLLPLVSSFNPFHSLYFPLRGHGWRRKGRNSDVIHHCNRRYRLAKRQTCRSFQRTLFMQKQTHTHTKLNYISGQETTL